MDERLTQQREMEMLQDQVQSELDWQFWCISLFLGDERELMEWTKDGVGVGFEIGESKPRNGQ